jgi:hypothetical protein
VVINLLYVNKFISRIALEDFWKTTRIVLGALQDFTLCCGGAAQEKWFCMSIKNPVHFSGLYGMRFIENLEIYFSKGVPDTVLPEFLARIRKITFHFEEKLA